MADPLPATVVHHLNQQAERFADRPALWTRRGGDWVATTWREYARKVKLFAQGLVSLGVKPGETVGILGFNREEWVVAHLGSMAAGAVPVGLYTTSSPEQLEYVLGHAQVVAVVVENEGYLRAVDALRPRLPKLAHLVVMDATPTLPAGGLAFGELLDRGARTDDAEYFARLDAAQPTGLATLIYTSGTTGHPKAVMLTHRNTVWTAWQLLEVAGVGEGDLMLSYLPLSHIAEQVCTIYGPVMRGVQVHFAESVERLPENLREVRPTVFFGVPRVWEKFKARALERVAEQPLAQRRLVGWARDVALRTHQAALEGRPVPFVLQAEYELARRTVFARLKARIGLDRCRYFATSAAPISRDVLDFFTSMDMVLREVYGQSEASGPTSLNTPDATRLGSLGRPMRGVQVRIASDGEILVKGDNVCAGYYQDEAATAELLQGGWLHSGDLGQLDADGYLRVVGRKKELIVTSGGKKTAPGAIESLLTGLEPIGHALVVGDRHPYLVAVLALDPDRVRAFAARTGLPMDPAALVASEAFRELLRQRIEAEVNPRLARFETVKKFHLLAQPFTVEGGELTPTLKVRRKVCEQKFGPAIEALYRD